MKRHGEAASAASDTVDKEWLRIREVIKEGGYKRRDVFNGDETGLNYVCVFLF